MTTIVEALNRIARQCSVKAPSSWVTASQDAHVELRDDFLAETVDDILDRIDLPSPIGAQTTITGTGAETYSLPSAFKRLHRTDLAVYDTQLDRACVPIPSDGLYTYIKDQGTAGTIRFYKVTGYEGNYSISFYDEPATGLEITVSYSTVNWMVTVGGTQGSTFTAEDDILLLPRRLVESGTVWRFRERRGLPYQDKYNEYEALIARTINDTRGMRVISMAEKPSVDWRDLVPSYIPDS